jgi:hypothetical protein
MRHPVSQLREESLVAVDEGLVDDVPTRFVASSGYRRLSKGITAQGIKALTPLMENQRRGTFNVIINVTNQDFNIERCVVSAIALCNMIGKYRLKLAIC